MPALSQGLDPDPEAEFPNSLYISSAFYRSHMHWKKCLRSYTNMTKMCRNNIWYLKAQNCQNVKDIPNKWEPAFGSETQFIFPLQGKTYCANHQLCQQLYCFFLSVVLGSYVNACFWVQRGIMGNKTINQFVCVCACVFVCLGCFWSRLY